jgi:hypothetical protein
MHVTPFYEGEDVPFFLRPLCILLKSLKSLTVVTSIINLEVTPSSEQTRRDEGDDFCCLKIYCCTYI